MKLTGLFEAIPLSMSQSRLDAYIFADLKLGYIKCAFFAPGSDLWKQLETPTEVMLLGPHEPRRYTNGKGYSAKEIEIRRRFIDAQEKAYLNGVLEFHYLDSELQRKYQQQHNVKKQLADLKEKMEQCQEEIQKLEIVVA